MVRIRIALVFRHDGRDLLGDSRRSDGFTQAGCVELAQDKGASAPAAIDACDALSTTGCVPASADAPWLAVSIESFNRDSKRSACRATDTRSSPDIPAKIGLRRLSGLSCESRLNNAK
jgi:hypothetical protein